MRIPTRRTATFAIPAPGLRPATIPVLSWAFLVLSSVIPIAASEPLFPPETAFSRIQHGWTNYSTAFLATHDNTSSDFGTVAGFYTPLCDVTPLEYAAIFVWGGPLNQQVNFASFSFQVHFWSGLAAFTNSPKQGNLATFAFARPTGGSTAVPDALTRGGRPAWLLRFALTNSALVLSNHQPCLVGIFARASSGQAGDLFVPTSRFAGESDLQAGNTIIGGWRYLADAGGATIYWGQLATELIVRPALSEPPTLSIDWLNGNVELRWPGSASCFKVESALEFPSASAWLTLDEQPTLLDGTNCLSLPAAESMQWFRLRK